MSAVKNNNITNLRVYELLRQKTTVLYTHIHLTINWGICGVCVRLCVCMCVCVCVCLSVFPAIRFQISQRIFSKFVEHSMGHDTYRGLLICLVHTTRARLCIRLFLNGLSQNWLGTYNYSLFAYLWTVYLQIWGEHTTHHNK
jgi:hypothetical protein